MRRATHTPLYCRGDTAGSGICVLFCLIKKLLVPRPGCSVVRTLSCSAKVAGLIPGQGTYKNQPMHAWLCGTRNWSLSLFPKSKKQQQQLRVTHNQCRQGIASVCMVQIIPVTQVWIYVQMFTFSSRIIVSRSGLHRVHVFTNWLRHTGQGEDRLLTYMYLCMYIGMSMYKHAGQKVL